MSRIRWALLAGAVLSLGCSAPTLDLRALERLARSGDVESSAAALLGVHYVEQMRASPLPRRLLRMKGEIDRSEEDVGRKLRYLFWLN